MTAPSPRPAASCACGPDHPAPDCDIRTHREQGRRERDEGVATGGELREAERRGYERGRRDFQFAPEGDNHHNATLCPYCSPALRDLLAERDTLAAKVEAVEGVIAKWRDGRLPDQGRAYDLSRALGTPTTGGGE